MNETNTNQTMTEEACIAVVKRAEETALLTYFRQFDVMGRALLLMKAKGMSDAKMYQQNTAKGA